MANRLEFDPSKIPCPNFESAAYAFMHNAPLADPNTGDVTSNEEAVQKLRSQWEAENNTLRTQFQAQIQAEEDLAVQRRLEAEEAQRLKEEEQRQKDVELAKELEKKRTPLYDFESGIGVSALPQHLHPYAEKRISQRKFVELWYFSPEASEEAKEQRSALETNRFELATDDARNGNTTFTLLSTHSSRPSTNATPDSRLSWAQISRTKSTFLNALPAGGYPIKFIAMFASFYTNMDMHSELQKQNGDLVMVHYHAEMQRAWFHANEKGKPFDLSVISDEVLQQSREEIRSRSHKRALEGTVSPPPHCTLTHLTMLSPPISSLTTLPFDTNMATLLPCSGHRHAPATATILPLLRSRYCYATPTATLLPC